LRFGASSRGGTGLCCCGCCCSQAFFSRRFQARDACRTAKDFAALCFFITSSHDIFSIVFLKNKFEPLRYKKSFFCFAVAKVQFFFAFESIIFYKISKWLAASAFERDKFPFLFIFDKKYAETPKTNIKNVETQLPYRGR
jgi:hypothetical protein